MASYTHKRKDYRITAIPLTVDMILSNGQKGKAGVHYFVNDEEGEQYIMTAERLSQLYIPVTRVNVEGVKSIYGIHFDDFGLNPNRYHAGED